VSSGRELRRRRVPRRVRKAYGARALPRPKEKGDRIRPSHCLSSLVTKATREISSTDSNQRLFRLAYLISSIISYHFASVHIYMIPEIVAVRQEGFFIPLFLPQHLFFSKALVGEHRALSFLHGHDLDSP
jgi:hypothetical protein